MCNDFINRKTTRISPEVSNSMQHKIRVAVALFVRNEEHDIAYWIAWHAAIGVTKFYIYDDHSDDETYDIIKLLSNLFDIDVEKTNKVQQPNFFWRQRDAYFSASRKANGHEEWLALLDGDEYLTLTDEINISEYMEKFHNYNAVAINWRIYGSSFRALDQSISPVFSYKLHSKSDFPDNRLVKSIIRPKDFSYDYRDPHRFIMLREAYADALGQSFVWSGSTKVPLWEGAVINHYICRSMESYTRRIARRIDSDLRNSTIYWNHFDRNDEYTEIRADLYRKSSLYSTEAKKLCLETAISSFSQFFVGLINAYQKKRKPHRKKSAKPKTVTISHAGRNLMIDHHSGFVGFNTGESTILLGRYVEGENIITVFREMNGLVHTDPFKIEGEPKYKFSYNLVLEYTNAGIRLRTETNGLYFGVLFDENLNFEKIHCTSITPRDTETFMIKNADVSIDWMVKEHDDPDFFSIADYLVKYAHKTTVNDLLLATSTLEQHKSVTRFLKTLAPVGWIF